MNNQDLHLELARHANHLRECFWIEVKRLTKIKLGHYGKNVNSRVGPLTSPLTWRTTLHFFWVWRSFSPALVFMSPNLGKQLDKMEEVADRLSSACDSYDSGDRCHDSYAAFQFMKKIEKVRDMMEGLPV